MRAYVIIRGIGSLTCETSHDHILFPTVTPLITSTALIMLDHYQVSNQGLIADHARHNPPLMGTAIDTAPHGIIKGTYDRIHTCDCDL